MTVRYRVVPFRELDSGKSMYTLVFEELRNGAVVRDNRHAMDKPTFEGLVRAVNTAWQFPPRNNDE